MSVLFRELFTVTAVVDKNRKNAPFEQRMQAIEVKLSERNGHINPGEQVVSNIKQVVSRLHLF